MKNTIFKKLASLLSPSSARRSKRYQPEGLGDLNLENRQVLSTTASQLPAHKLVRAQSTTAPQHSPLSVIVKNLNEEFYRVSTSFADGLGTTPDQMVGKTDYDYYPADLAAKYQADDRKVIASRRIWKIVETNIIDGVPETVTVIKTPIFLGYGPGAGLPVGIKIVSRVDKNQTAEPYSKPISPPLIPNAPARWIILSPKVSSAQPLLNATVKDGSEVVYRVNQNFANGLNMAPAEIVGKTDYDLYPADLASKYQANDYMVIASRQKWQFVEHNIQDNKLIEVSVFKTPLFKKQGVGYGLSAGIKIVFTSTKGQNNPDTEKPVSSAFPVGPATIPVVY
jgi:hypothetical protein